jgi:hypothetical protein
MELRYEEERRGHVIYIYTHTELRYEEERRGHGLPGKGVVLCNFNHLHKTSRAQWAVWARILRGVRSRMLTYAHVCSRMLTYAHVCSRMLTYAVLSDAEDTAALQNVYVC